MDGYLPGIGKMPLLGKWPLYFSKNMKITFGSDIVLGLQYGFSITDAASAPGPLADGIVTEDDVQIITEDGESVVIES